MLIMWFSSIRAYCHKKQFTKKTRRSGFVSTWFQAACFPLQLQSGIGKGLPFFA